MSASSSKGPLGLLGLGSAPGAAVVGGLIVVVAAVAATTLTGVLAAKVSVNAPTITAGPTGSVSSTSASFSFTDSPASLTFQCQLDAGAIASCTSPKPYSGLAAGSHTFQVRAISGSDQSAFTSRTWTVDFTAPPTPTFTTKPASVSNTPSPYFGFADGEAGVSYLCKLDAAATFTACSNPQGYSGLAQGGHSMSVKAVDAAGNMSAIPASYGWTVDTVAPPTPVIVQKPSDPSPNATNTFTWTESESGTTFECAAESGIFAACSSPYTYIVDTSNNGQHQFAVRAVDAAGNRSGEATYKFKYDKGQPSSGIPFTISGTVSGLMIGVWKPISVTLGNPNSVPIYVKGLTVSFTTPSGPAGCASSANMELQQSNLSTSQFVLVPAGGSVTLPAQGAVAPQIRLKDLPTVNQDSCKGRNFPLNYSGTATN